MDEPIRPCLIGHLKALFLRSSKIVLKINWQHVLAFDKANKLPSLLVRQQIYEKSNCKKIIIWSYEDKNYDMTQ